MDEKGYTNPLAISTEDGRVIFFAADSNHTLNPASQIPDWPAIGQIGGGIENFGSRIKDFEYLTVLGEQSQVRTRLMVTGSSGGVIGVWKLELLSNLGALHSSGQIVDAPEAINGQKPDWTMSENIPAIGQLLGKYEVGNRITCLKAFLSVEVDDEQDVIGPISSDHLERRDNTEVMNDGS